MLVRELRTHLYYKIIVPFLLLAFLVAMIGSTFAFLIITGSAQERLNNQLAQTARNLSDSVVAQENANLQFLREVSFAVANPRSGAPAISTALADGDTAGLELALDPYFQIAAERAGLRADRLIAFDRDGRAIVDWEALRTDDGRTPRIRREPRSLQSLWFVPAVLNRTTDQQGDKFAGLIDFDDSDTRYLFTVAPVTRDTVVVGGVVVAMRLDSLLNELAAESQATIVSLYQAEDGSAVASTLRPIEGLQELNMRDGLAAQTAALTPGDERSIFDTRTINAREYQFSYAPLRIRNETIGLIATALATDYVISPWANARAPLITMTLLLMTGIITTGLIVARQITRPLDELVQTARAVMAGKWEQRSNIQTNDEIGILAGSFNSMTNHLLDLYRSMRNDARHQAAIIASISDGVVVAAPDGKVQVINRAARDLLGLAPDDEPPVHMNDIPFEPPEVGGSANHAGPGELFRLRDRLVRTIASPVHDDDDQPSGVVVVLQDVTTAIGLDRAKSNFIATASHEMRTPLTVIGGNLDLLMRNLVGELNEAQRELTEIARTHVGSLTNLLNNMIMVASIDLGALEIEVRPLMLDHILRDVLRVHGTPFAERGFTLHCHLPAHLPQVLGDEHYVLKVIDQLLDNARRYSNGDKVTLRAVPADEGVRVDVIDNGGGIGPDLRAQLFDRFTRGTRPGQGINSGERGAGLGLAIARQLMLQQRGRLWLADTSENGSTFSFLLPYAPSSRPVLQEVS